MDSPQFIGDSTTASISNQLYGTHLNRNSNALTTVTASPPAVFSAVYSGQKFILISVQLNTPAPARVVILRRVQDSYVNVSQMFRVLILLNFFTKEQVDAFFYNEVFTNSQYLPGSNGYSQPLFNDFSDHEVPQIRGLWVPYDKAIQLAVKFDLYKLIKRLFLIDVHDIEKLPKADSSEDSVESPSPSKRSFGEEGSFIDSPSKKRKLSSEASQSASVILKAAIAANTNRPYTLPPSTYDEKDRDIVSEAKLEFSEIFKSDAKDSVTKKDIASRFKAIIDKCHAKNLKPSTLLDVSLDQLGKTALHYASTLASTNLVSSFIELKICSPIRGDKEGQSPLISTLQVTNAMEKGNFADLLSDWLWPNLFLFDNKYQSFLHYLVQSATKNFKSAKFYLTKILEWIFTNPDKESNVNALCGKIINAQDSKNGNTALHLAGEHGLKWFVFVFLELNAEINLENNTGVKVTNFECVNQVIELRKAHKSNPASISAMKALLDDLEVDDENDEYLFSLIQTGVEFYEKQSSFTGIGELEDEQSFSKKPSKINTEVAGSSLLSNKILKSIQELLSNTNEEYEKVIHAKKREINNLNEELRDATIVTANNRFIAKNITHKMSQVDTLKIQIANINDRLQSFRKDVNGTDDEQLFGEDLESETLALEKINADEPFLIKPIYEKIANNEEVEPSAKVIESLPSKEVLKARLNAYETVNANLEQELEKLVDYCDLTAKFKKVVSYCTGVDINEIDELLDGLLEAVEGQQ